MTRRLALMAILALAAAVLPGRGGVASSKLLMGPGQDGNWYSVSAAVDVDEPFSFGNFVAAPPDAADEIRVQSVKLTGVEGLEVIGIAANGGEREFGMVGALAGYPLPQFSDDPEPIPGAIVPHGGADDIRKRGLSLTFGVKRTSEGRGYATGFEVVFRVAGKEFKQRFNSGVALCAERGFNRADKTVTPTCEPVPDRTR